MEQVKTLQMLARLEELRQMARRVLGARYAVSIGKWRTLLRAGMQYHQVDNELAALLAMRRELMAHGKWADDMMIWLAAAALDEIEGVA